MEIKPIIEGCVLDRSAVARAVQLERRHAEIKKKINKEIKTISHQLIIKPPSAKNSVENQPNIHRISIIESKERKTKLYLNIKIAYNPAKSISI